MCEASAARALNVFMKQLYSGDFWLTGTQRDTVLASGTHFLRATARLAFLAFREGRERYPLTPKHHMMFHVLNFLQWSSDMAGFGPNPISESCAQDEDYVGRLARICRAVSPRATCLRTLQRYLLQVREVWYQVEPDA